MLTEMWNLGQPHLVRSTTSQMADDTDSIKDDALADAVNETLGKRKTRTVHPKPVNKKAQLHLQKLQRLGYSNYNEVDLDYWEPRLIDETTQAHQARRQKECKNMDALIARMEARQRTGKDESLQSEAQALELANKQLEQKMKKYRAELEMEREARLKAEEELTKVAPAQLQEKEGRRILKLEAQLEEEKLRCAHAEDLATQQRAKRKDLEKRLEEEKMKRRQVEGEVQLLKNEIKSLQDGMLELKQQLEEQSSAHKEQSEKLQDENNVLSEEIKDLKDELKQLQSSSSSSEYQVKIREANEQLASGRREIVNLKLINQKMEMELEKQKEKDKQLPLPPLTSRSGLVLDEAFESMLEKKLEQVMGLMLQKVEEKLSTAGQVWHNAQQQPQMTVATRKDPSTATTPADENGAFQFPKKKVGKPAKRKEEPRQPVRPLFFRVNSVESTGSAGTTVDYNTTNDVGSNTHVNSMEKRNYAKMAATGAKYQERTQKKNAEPNWEVPKYRRKKKREAQKQPTQTQHPQSHKKKEKRRILVLPSEENPGSVSKRLCELDIDHNELGITDIPVEYPSGAAILLADEGKLPKLREALVKAGLCEKQRKQRLHEFRIHDIPINATIENVSAAIEAKTGLRPASVELNKYKTKESQVANCSSNEELYSALEEIYTVFIRFKKCPVDTRPNLVVCRRCSALGHTRKHCPHDDEKAMQMKNDAGDKEKPCINCTAHNEEIHKRKGARALIVDPKHPTQDNRCPMLRRHLDKYYRDRRRIDDDDLAEQASPQQHSNGGAPASHAD